MNNLTFFICLLLFSAKSLSSEDLCGEYHADTRSNWGWVLNLDENSAGRMIAIEMPNESDPCINAQQVIEGAWLQKNQYVVFKDKKDKVYGFKIIGENTIKLISPKYEALDESKSYFRKNLTS